MIQDSPLPKSIAGSRVLVVEDEMIVLMDIEDMLADLGCTAVSTAATVRQALDLIETHDFDVATVDLNLNGDRSHAVADALAAAGVPFAFSTGYSGPITDGGHDQRPILRKPYQLGQFRETLTRLLA